MDEMQKEFERWFSNDGKFPNAVAHAGNAYKRGSAQAAWISWQACWKFLDDCARKNAEQGDK